MRISDLREFASLAQTLSFTKTARKLYISQPVLSKHISALEAELGFGLFVRGKRGIALTPAGRVFAEGVERCLAELEEATAKAGEASLEGGRRVTVAYLMAFCRGFLSKLDMAFARSSGCVEMRYRGMVMDDLRMAVHEESADVYLAPEIVECPKGYESVVLHEFPYALVVGKGHRLASREAVTLEDLKGSCVRFINPDILQGYASDLERFLEPVRPYVALRGDVPEVDNWVFALSDRKTIGLECVANRKYLGDEVVFVPFAEGVEGVPQVRLCALWKEGSDVGAVGRYLDELFAFSGYSG